jgi:hypothetical protein
MNKNIDKQVYIIPDADIICFESDDKITASGDYVGINFDDLI